LLRAAKAQLALQQLNLEARAQVATFRHLARSILPTTSILAAATQGPDLEPSAADDPWKPNFYNKPMSVNYLMQERDRVLSNKIAQRITELKGTIKTSKIAKKKKTSDFLCFRNLPNSD